MPFYPQRKRFIIHLSILKLQEKVHHIHKTQSTSAGLFWSQNYTNFPSLCLKILEGVWSGVKDTEPGHSIYCFKFFSMFGRHSIRVLCEIDGHVVVSVNVCVWMGIVNVDMGCASLCVHVCETAEMNRKMCT